MSWIFKNLLSQKNGVKYLKQEDLSLQSQSFQRGKWLKGIVWIKVSMSKEHQENRSIEKLELEIKSFESKAKEIELSVGSGGILRVFE